MRGSRRRGVDYSKVDKKTKDDGKEKKRRGLEKRRRVKVTGRGREGGLPHFTKLNHLQRHCKKV